MTSSPKVYLITGCSSGLGVDLVKSALASNAKVIATARNPSKNPSIHKELKDAGATWVRLDVTSDDLEAQFHEAVAIHGRIDVLINNAGLGGTAGPVEETPLSEAQIPFATNFWGAVRLTQAAIPVMRAHHGGTIVNISSNAAFDCAPGISFYSASKAALDAVTTSLAVEVAPFGIKTILVNPGDIRTPMLDQSKTSMMRNLGEPYKEGPVKHVYDFLLGLDGNQTIDPRKAADRIVDAVKESETHTGMSVIRLPIGTNSAVSIKKYGEGLLQRVQETEAVWSSVQIADGK